MAIHVHALPNIEIQQLIKETHIKILFIAKVKGITAQADKAERLHVLCIHYICSL